MIAAQYHLGAYYATEAEMPIDYQESLRYYRMAADNGSLEALYNLGTMYQDAEGVVKDEAHGNALILHAAEQGQSLAQRFLMQAYEYGYHGIPIDKDEAAYWRHKHEAEIVED